MAGHLLLVILMYSIHEIKVQGQKPQISLHPFSGDNFLFTCSLPGSANNNTPCNLYVGEESRPVLTTTWKKRASATRQRFCEFTVRAEDLLRHLHCVQQKDASCDYNSGSEPNSLSPRSDGYNLTDFIEIKSSMAPTVTAPVNNVWTQPTTEQAEYGNLWKTSQHTLGPGKVSGVSEAEGGDRADKKIWKVVVVGTGCGVSVGIILLGSAILSTLKRTGKCVCPRPKDNVTAKSKYGCGRIGSLNSGEYFPGGCDETYSIVTYEFSNTE